MKLAELPQRIVRGTKYPDPRVNGATDNARRRAVAGEPRRHGASGPQDKTKALARLEAAGRRRK